MSSKRQGKQDFQMAESLKMAQMGMDYELREEEDHKKKSRGLSSKDKKAMALLVLLYLLQGIPLGLTMGSLPYLLQPHLSYSSIGLFSLAGYPYSLKLLWSPIVDACYSERFGRRKSWILPVQFTAGLALIFIGGKVDLWIDTAETTLYTLTLSFFLLVLLCATQDIAVDGWALTLLSEENLSYASTAQTIGLNTGYFMSFTVFLAFNSSEFANTYFRSKEQYSSLGLISLSTYMTVSGWIFVMVTGWLILAKTEAKELNVTDNVRSVYQSIWKVSKLPQVRSFMLIHLIAKIGFIANDSATNLKFLEKGLKKEQLSLAVLIDFPFEILFGYYAAKWSTGPRPLDPWLWAFSGRLVAALMGMTLVYFMPTDVGTGYFTLILFEHVFGSFMSTVQFVSASAFHTQIADPLIGGTYMTLLNTISNLGGTWPKYFVLEGVDYFTQSVCRPENVKEATSISFDIVNDAAKKACLAQGGQVVHLRDGYYIINTFCMILGLVSFVAYIKPRIQTLQGLPLKSWKISR